MFAFLVQAGLAVLQHPRQRQRRHDYCGVLQQQLPMIGSGSCCKLQHKDDRMCRAVYKRSVDRRAFRSWTHFNRHLSSFVLDVASTSTYCTAELSDMRTDNDDDANRSDLERREIYGKKKKFNEFFCAYLNVRMGGNCERL